MVRKLRVPDELTTQQSAGRALSDLGQSHSEKLLRRRRGSQTQETSLRNHNRTEFRSQVTLRNRCDMSPGSDSNSPCKGYNDLRARSDSPASCASDPASPSRNDSSEEESATKEYQKAISNLRSAQGVSKAMAKTTKPQASRVKEKQFLAECEVGDDWLEVDVLEVGGGKKRKYRDTGREGEWKRVRSELTKKPEVNREYDVPSKPAKQPPPASSFESIPKRKSFSPPPEPSQRKQAVVSRTKSFEPSQNLFPDVCDDFEQALDRVESSEQMQIEWSTSTPSAGTLCSSRQLSRSNTSLPHTPSMQDAMTSIKIKIEAHTFLIPIIRDDSLLGGEKRISWLKQEASERYYRLEGVTPVLRIKTQDGALIDDTDPLASILSETLVLTEVVNWNKPPVIERYHQLCREGRVLRHKHFECTLTANTPRFTICSCAKSASVLLCLFRTMLHWTDLVDINLSRTFLKDDDVRALSENVTNLSKLHKLSISCNHVTHVGIKYLSEQCVHISRLREIDVSFNPLTDAVLPHLNMMIAMCPQLSSINLSHTNLTRIDSDLNLCNTENIDVSRNKLGVSQVRKLLSLLNADLLVSLNLSSTLETPASLQPKRISLAAQRPLTPCENKTIATNLTRKSPNLYFDSGKTNNRDTRCDSNLPDIISMVPKNPTLGNDYSLESSTFEPVKAMHTCDRTDMQHVDELEHDENCRNVMNKLDVEQDELDRLLNSSPIMNLPDSEHIPVGTTRDYDDSNSVGITREVVLFLEQSERLALKSLSLCDIDMTNDEADMLFNVLRDNAKALIQLNVACNRNLSQSRVDLFKCILKDND